MQVKASGDTDTIPDMADGIRDVAAWLVTLSTAIDRMPQIQRHELLRAVRGLRRDLRSIRLEVPSAVTR